MKKINNNNYLLHFIKLKIDPEKVCNFTLRKKGIDLRVTVWQNDHDTLSDISK